MGCSPYKKNNKSEFSNSMFQSKYVANSTNSLKINAGIFISKRKGSIYDYYTIEQKLGAGSFGFVRAGISKANGEKRAIKSINKKKISDDMKERSKFFSEVDILMRMDHPNIVQLYEFFEDENYYHLVTEFVIGGELLDFIIKEKCLSEPVAASFMKQLLSGISYCHENNIVHRDLKPENLLLDRRSSDAVLKIIDFGTSQIFKRNESMTHKYGTVLYVAPEVLEGSYDEKCDIWSCGVILYILLSGRPPYSGRSEEEIIGKILYGRYSLESPEWKNVSSEAKSLVKQMLHKEAYMRISAQQALNHEWIVRNMSSSQPTTGSEENKKNSLENLQNFRAECKLQQAVLTFIASQLVTKEQTKKFIDAFKVLDKNGDGRISREELIEAYRVQMGEFAAMEEVEKIMKKADANNSGFIDYTEFVMASAEANTLICNKNLEDAFKAFDTDGSGKISAKELKQVLGSKLRARDKIWKKLIMEVDENGDGELDIDEFKSMMMKLISMNM
ncbi:hypothetical protein SteCoe_19570 [Stentor coeruleus]|uniref:Calcium-dependent protein kinase 1 n=1 Tax=Stentor coeruleus TaxID=5963 RepID=A0A1R2BTR1_9CILI|nr:hypothetical protein SteCoe_19570 [Stentor coeruleus]